MAAPPPPGCWACGTVPTAEDISHQAVLHPRTAAEGGPWTGMACGSCGAEGVLVEADGEAPVLAPPEAAGVESPAVAVLLDGRRARDLRRRAREWMERWAAGLADLRAGRRAPRPPRPAPPPPGGSRRPTREPPPPLARPPRRPSVALPRTPEEAREILGIAAGADRKEVDDAFRRRSRKCHPDLVAHLDEDFQRLAHEKFLRLKRAQEILNRGG